MQLGHEIHYESKEEEIMIEGTPGSRDGFKGTQLRRAMYDWDKEHSGQFGNPHAREVYSKYPPAGGS